MRVDTGFVPLATERLLLRRSAPEDAEAISAYRSDPQVRRHQGWERTDADHIRAEIRQMASRAPGQDGGWVQLSVLDRGSGTLVGDVGFARVEGEPGVVKLGYTISPPYQGRGIATEAVHALVGYLFDVLGAELVRAYADAENVASIRVAQKVGMRVVERFEHRHRGEVWHGVRMELPRAERSGTVQDASGGKPGPR